MIYYRYAAKGIMINNNCHLQYFSSLSLSHGDFSIFFTRPISLFLVIVAGIIMVSSAWQAWPAAIREEGKEAQV